MKASFRTFLSISLSLAPVAAYAVNVPLPVEGATMNLSMNLQTHALFNEAGSVDGTSWSTDLFIRRSRLGVSGEIAQHFWYFAQVDNPNFAKYGNFTSRLILQDAVFAFVPTGLTGGNVVFIEAGLQRVPFTRGSITNVNNNFTIDGHPDLIRGFNGAVFPANRSTGVEIRGWALGRKVAFRAGVFEGVRATAADPGLNPNSIPLFSGFLNFNILGTQEGGYSYDYIYFAKEPLLSISLSGGYQSRVERVPKGLADLQSANSTAFFEYPFSENTEVIAELTGYRSSVGTGSKDTGWGWGADLGYRWKWVRPYASIEQFTSDDCPTDPTQLTGAALTTCLSSSGAHSADSRNFRAGFDFFFNKTLNHLMVEFSVNHGQSSWGPQNITAATAGYVPLSLDPLTPGGPRRPINTLLSSPAQHSLLAQWAVVF